MADYYILTQSKKKDQAEVVFHIAIPATNNFADIPLRTAVKELGTIYNDRNGVALPIPAPPQTRIPFLGSVIKQQVADGEIWEEQATIKFNANLTKAQKQTIIDDIFTSKSGTVLTRLQDELDFWGFEGTVV